MLSFAFPVFLALLQPTDAIETLVSALFANTTSHAPSSSDSAASTHNLALFATSSPQWIDQVTYSNPYTGYELATTLTQCSNAWESSLSAWSATAALTTVTTTSTEIEAANTFVESIAAITDSEGAETQTIVRTDTTYTTTLAASATTNSIGTTYTDTNAGFSETQTQILHLQLNAQKGFTYTPAPSCCSACSLYGGNVTVYHWPTPAPTPAVSSLVDAAGFTFVSPSVYVIFSALSATDLCGPVGNEVSSTTLAFKPGDISTALMSNVQGGIVANEMWTTLGSFESANFNTEADCSTSYSLSAHSVCEGTPDDCGAQYTYIWSSCSPYLSVPTQIYSVNPGWHSCAPGISAFLDPPSVLSAGATLTPWDPTVHGLAAATSTPATPQSVAPPATPTPTIVTPTPTPTPTTSIKAEESGGLTPGFLTPVSLPVANTPKASSPVANSPAADPSPSSPSTPSTTLVLAPVAETSPVDPAPAQNPVSSPVQAQKPSSVEQPAVVVPQAQSTNNPAVVPAPVQTPQQAASNVAPSVNTSPAVANSPAASKSLVGDSPVANSPAANSPSQAANSPAANSPAANSPSANLPAAKSPTSAIPILVGTNTIAAGAPAVTISGTTYSVASTGGGLVINNSVTKVVGQAAPTPNSVAAPAPFVAGTQTVTPGSAAVVVAGTTYSIPSSGGAVVINEATSTFAQLAPLVTPTTPSYLIASQTLAAGGSAITLSSSTISLQSGGQSVVVAGSSATQTLALSEVFPSAAPITPTYSVASADPTYFYGSQTLAFGGAAITVSSSLLVSLLSGGSSVLVEGSTTTQTLALSDAFVSSEYVLATGTSVGMGGLIESLGGFATPTTSASGAGYTGPMVGGGNGSYSGPWVSHGGRVEVGALAAWSIATGLTMLGIVLL